MTGSVRLAPRNGAGKPNIFESLLFLLLLTGPPRLRARDPYASLSGDADWSVLLNAGVWALGALWVFLNLGGYVYLRRSIPRFGALHIIALVLVISLYISVMNSVSPALTFYRVSQILIAVLFGFFWVRRFGVDSTLKHLGAGFVLLGVAVAVSAVLAPEQVYSGLSGQENRLRGDNVAPTGSVAAMGLILALSYPFLRNRFVYVAAIGFLVALLLLSQTRTAYGVVLAFILLGLVRIPSSKPLRSFLYLFALSVPVVLMSGWGTAVFERLIREQESISTLSARIPLWRYVVSESLEQSPLFGVGFYANRYITSRFEAGLGTSHSAFIEVLSGGGLVSFSIFMLMIALLLFLATQLFFVRGQDPEVFAVVSLLLGALVIGLTSEQMVIASPVSFTFWLLLSLIPTIASTPSVARMQRGEVGLGKDHPSGARVLPAARR